MDIKSELQKSKMIMKAWKGILPYYCRFFPVLAAKTLYKQTFQKRLDLSAPKDLNEKINWLKIYFYRKDKLVAKCADKFQVREYVKSCGCAELLNDLLGVYQSVDEIDWDKLPDAFALKYSSAAGMNFICESKEKYEKEQVIRMMRGWFSKKPGDYTGELHYRNTKPVLICERYIKSEQKLPVDYKIFCLNGKPYISMVCLERGKKTKYLFADEKYRRVYIDTPNYPDPILPPKPNNYEAMFEYAAKLAEPFPFVRVDFYEEAGKLIFGELTFTPFGGYMVCMNQKGLDETGARLILPLSAVKR